MQISNFTESKPGLAVLWVNQKQANEEKDLNFERTSDKYRVYWTTLIGLIIKHIPVKISNCKIRKQS